jgi:hypothetical protein|tara:strand:+ start:205 stop:378 length:174 start_codon:yes stop_codon:yes gene_type:complete
MNKAVRWFLNLNWMLMKPSQNLLTVQGKMRRIGLLKLAETLALLQDHRLMEGVGTIG